MSDERPERLPFEERLGVQLMNLTAAGVDLRSLKGNPELRELVWDIRAIRDRALWKLVPYVSEGDYQWAKERLRVRAGLSTNSWWMTGQRPDENDPDDDLRVVLKWIEATQ